ncbi:MAG: sigma-54-dependent Fis family transcriptional regulator [Chlamydiia bacterium]|nr:sigma-54-dependent Fis family transcriptional regulator [Chlamydiia bacterium]
MQKVKILIVEDDAMSRECIKMDLEEVGVLCNACKSVKELSDIMKNNSKKYDLIIADMNLKDGTGIDCIRIAKDIKVIIITGYGSINNAVSAMKFGAVDYLEKPITIEKMEMAIKRGLEYEARCPSNRSENNLDASKGPVDLIHKSSSMKNILEIIEKIAKSNASVFIQGESGVGKEVIAQLIHDRSNRSKNEFVSVNCAAIPDSLVETELFGHSKGAFTGADSERVGKFEFSNRGTMLLDEITEMPVNLQAKILRVLQERTVSKIGSNKTLNLDMRIISTSNRDIDGCLKSGLFRQDLFYRLNVFSITIPPLRDRREDIVPIAKHFLDQFSKKYNSKIVDFTKDAKIALSGYEWPGNVREVKNVIERFVILNRDKKLLDISF